MARRKARIPQGKKLQPAVKTMQFSVPLGQNTISLSQCASLVNRRFYRAGLNWAVAGFTVITAQGTSGSIAISKIPDTWIASNAWEKGFHAWNDMNNEALESTESIKPKFTDFKVYMDDIHHQAGVGANLIPQDALTNVYTPGTWDMSEMTIPTSGATGNATDFEIIWTGPSYPGVAPTSGLDAVSLIEGYASSRGLPDIRDPNAPADASDVGPTGTLENWIGALDNEGTDQDKDVLANMLADNTEAPYPFENGPNPAGGVFTDTQYPGGANQAPGLEPHEVALITSTTVGGKTTIPGTNFQGGLIRVYNNTDEAGLSLFVHLVPGSHRGYMCQKMQDV